MNRPEPQQKPLTIDRTPAVKIENFGKDHWSLLAYIACRVESHQAGDAVGVGTLDKEQIRCNPERHEIHAVSRAGHERTWKPSYGTRLAGFWKEGGGTDPALQMPDHDDWDCLDDLEAAGIIEVLSEANAFVRITEAGLQVYGALTQHKASGGNFSEFRWPLPKKRKTKAK